MSKKSIKSVGLENDEYGAVGDRALLEMYRAFMDGYVKRINDATFNVTIGGVRVGSAKYTRLAQINLRSRVITFSRFAIENVPERGRRYLVLHELAHVKEANHNKNFWEHVGRYEPNYREVREELGRAFTMNIRKNRQKRIEEMLRKSGDGSFENSAKLLGSHLMNNKSIESLLLANETAIAAEEADLDLNFGCTDDETTWEEDSWQGTMNGGSEDEF
ncbi:MAG TPA: M48 family metallopeptidase [Drouetiella sp.]